MIDPAHKQDSSTSDVEAVTEQELRGRSRRNFFALAAGTALSVGGWEWLNSRADEGDVPGPFRRALELNEKVTGRALFDDAHRAPEFAPSRVQELQPNGDIGLENELDAKNWRLEVAAWGNTAPSRSFTLADIRLLPKVEQTIEFKCIEGWSAISSWGGVRLSDFAARFIPGFERARYVGMTTPDRKYYVGLDAASALHPQTLLAFEKEGRPLEDEHGAPLRLIIPVKYGIKNLKRIGSIFFSDVRPADYWAEQGYDYYAGL